jgi:hypothetical protein
MIPSSTQETELAEIPGRHISEIPASSNPRLLYRGSDALTWRPPAPSQFLGSLGYWRSFGRRLAAKVELDGVMLCFLAFLKLAVC